MEEKKVLNISTKTINEFRKLEKEVRDSQASGKKSQIAIASALYFMSNEKFNDLLEDAGYKNIGEYAEAEFGIQKTACYDAIMIMELCGDSTKKNIHARFGEYSYTQLKYIAKRMKQLQKSGNENCIETAASEMSKDMSTREMAEHVKSNSPKREKKEESEQKNDSTRAENAADSNGEIKESVNDPTLEDAIMVLTNFYNEHGYLFKTETATLVMSISRATGQLNICELD